MELTLDTVSAQLLSTSEQSKNPFPMMQDEKGNLILFCINTNDGVSSNVMQDVGVDAPKSTIIHKARGIVFDRRDGKCVNDRGMFPFEYQSNEVHATRMNNDFEKYDIDISDLTISWAIEGTVLRVFNYESQWHISTHRKLDADKSAWRTSISFKALFEEALAERNFEEFCNLRLNASLQYTFLLTANETSRFVCNPSKQHDPLYLVEIYDFEGKKILDESHNTFVDIKYIPRVDVELESLNDAFRLVNELHFDINKFSLQQQAIAFGINLHCPLRDLRFRIVNETYQRYFNVIGNAKCLENQYLENIDNEENLAIIKYLNPNMLHEFNKIDAAMRRLPRDLMRLLAQRLKDKTKQHVKTRYDWARRFEATLFSQSLHCIRELISFSEKETSIKNQDVERKFPNLKEAVKMSIKTFLNKTSEKEHVRTFVHIDNFPSRQTDKILVRPNNVTKSQIKLRDKSEFLSVKDLTSNFKSMEVTLQHEKPFFMFRSNRFMTFASNAVLLDVRRLEFIRAREINSRVWKNEDSFVKRIRSELNEQPNIYYCDFLVKTDENEEKVLKICVCTKTTNVCDVKDGGLRHARQLSEFINNSPCQRKIKPERNQPIFDFDEETIDSWRVIHEKWANDMAMRRLNVTFK